MLLLLQSFLKSQKWEKLPSYDCDKENLDKFLTLLNIMEKDKSKFEIEKNKLSKSAVSAGENVHIGDVYNIQHVSTEIRNEKKEEKIAFKKIVISKYISISLISTVLVVIGGKVIMPIFEKKDLIIYDEPKEIPESHTKLIVSKPPKRTQASNPKLVATNVNYLEVVSNSQQFNSLFSSYMGEMLKGAKIEHQQSSNGRIDNHVRCTFDLQKSKIESGMREAFKYALTLQIEVIGDGGKSCFSGFYSSAKSRIGYLEDSEDVLREKVIEPCLAEVKTAFQQNEPTLCIDQ